MERASSEFFLIASPANHIIVYAAFLKDTICEALHYGFQSRYSIAHVSLFRYRARNENFLYQLEDRLRSCPSFHVFVKNFGVFTHGPLRTLYLDIVNKAPLMGLAEVIHGHTITPHITIAKSLSLDELRIAQQAVHEFPYSDSFHCDRVTVLMRRHQRWLHHTDLWLHQS